MQNGALPVKTTMVIPSYWTRESALGSKSTDAVYDHPIPLDEEGTLKRALESINILENKDFNLVIIAVANAQDIEKKVEDKVARIILSSRHSVPVYLFSHSHLKRVHQAIRDAGGRDFLDLLELRGYSNIRNLCLFLPHILGSDMAVLIDDDEVFEDPGFMSKTLEFIGKTFENHFVGAVAGYYLQPDGDWRVKKEKSQWMEHWNKFDSMNEAFEKIIGKEPRLKETPFVFGGNMVVHREIFTHIPFDPSVTRGEDIDFLINMKMFGYKFFLDNQLSIKHLPPPKPHPTWKLLREDIHRFVVEREKLRGQVPMENMSFVSADELDPYPGVFLKDDLEEKIAGACTILADDYLAEGKEGDAREALKNIEIAKGMAVPKENAFQRLVQIKDQWEKMMDFTVRENMREQLREILKRI